MGAFDVLLLAAGASRRMGTPKQLLPIDGQSLIRRAAQQALESGADSVTVIVGANADTVGGELESLPVQVLHNPNWEQGMGTSISLGISALAARSHRVVIQLADQPFVTSDHLRALGDATADIAATEYQTIIGAPCAFSRSKFAALLELKQDEGARKILKLRANEVHVIPFEAAAVDLDTPDDFRAITNSSPH